MNHVYDDIIHLPHHVSKRHPPMSMDARAAQFAPFSALNGLSQAIRQANVESEERCKPQTSDEF